MCLCDATTFSTRPCPHCEAPGVAAAHVVAWLVLLTLAFPGIAVVALLLYALCHGGAL